MRGAGTQTKEEMEQAWNEARHRWPRRTAKAEKVHIALGGYLEWLKRNFEPKLVILFGSYADGTFRMDSDVDILVVASRLPESNARMRLRQFDFPAPLQPFPYSPEEFLERCRNDDAIVYSALTEGQILYIDPEFRPALLAAL